MSPEAIKSLQEAFARMKSALELLDAANAPADIGAHLDLALSRLEDALSVTPQPAESSQSAAHAT